MARGTMRRDAATGDMRTPESAYVTGGDRTSLLWRLSLRPPPWPRRFCGARAYFLRRFDQIHAQASTRGASLIRDWLPY